MAKDNVLYKQTNKRIYTYLWTDEKAINYIPLIIESEGIKKFMTVILNANLHFLVNFPYSSSKLNVKIIQKLRFSW